MECEINFCLNLDKRDSNGKPTLTKTPKGFLTIHKEDVVHFTISTIENGAEHNVYTAHLWNDMLHPNFENELTKNQTEKMIV